jgi:hypothetical protein
MLAIIRPCFTLGRKLPIFPGKHHFPIVRMTKFYPLAKKPFSTSFRQHFPKSEEDPEKKISPKALSWEDFQRFDMRMRGTTFLVVMLALGMAFCYQVAIAVC